MNEARRSNLPGISTLLLTIFGLTGVLHAAEPMLSKSNIFEAGMDGYKLYRIPGIVATAKGTLLAYCEARKSDKGDWGHIDIVLRRSSDGGASWEPMRKIVAPPKDAERNPAAVKQGLGKPGEITANNPVAIVDHKTGAVHFLYCIEYGRCFSMRSDDDGKTFSEPVEITATFDKFRPDYSWKVLATGPGHGIQLKSGRLIVPVWLSDGSGGHAHRPSCVATIYSDDHGKSWQRSDIVVAPPEPVNPSETVPLELADGRVLLNFRHESPNRLRGVVTGKDGSSGWSKPCYDPQLPEPICMASIVRLSLQPAAGKNRVLFANPDNPKDRARRNLTVRLSYDEAQTWAFSKAIEPGPSGYSDLAVGPDGSIYCFYERGAGDSQYQTRFLCVAKFNTAWLTDGKDRGD